MCILKCPRGSDTARTPAVRLSDSSPGGGPGAHRSVCSAAETRASRKLPSRGESCAAPPCSLCPEKHRLPLVGSPHAKTEDLLPPARHLGCPLSIESCSPDLQ